MPLLSVRISVDYPQKPNVLEDVAFDIDEGEIFGLAGESGAGKSTIALAILRLLDMRGGRVRGRILFGGRDLMTCGERELRRIRGREMALVPQSPIASLNPALRLETQIREAWRAHSPVGWSDARRDVVGLLCRMGLPEEDSLLRRYPSQISVGQAQRVVIAMAMLHKPRLIIADEPSSALDPGWRAGILGLFRSLNRDSGTAILYISHDDASMAELCHRTANIAELQAAYCGRIQMSSSTTTEDESVLPPAVSRTM
jgi:ABC-type glutathione transport system ATPase component